MLKKIISLSLLTTSLFAGNINIAAAANVSYSIDTLKKEFNKLYPDTNVKVTLGSSGKLTSQIKYGAPYDLFMSANIKYPELLYKDGLAVTKPVVYALGALSYFSTRNINFSNDINFLKNKNIRKIAVANPKTAPYGKATLQALKNAKLYNQLKHKFIYAESISQTVSYCVTAADVGIIAKSALYSSKMALYKRHIHYKDVDPKLYTAISQAVVILKRGENNEEVKAFYNFILSQKGKKIFKDFGYLIP